MNQAQQPKPVIAPQSPKPPAAPDVPRTPAELDALAAKRSELKQQLEGITDRREELADQLDNADAAARPGLEARIQVLDERAGRLEREILLADDAIAAAIAAGVQGQSHDLIAEMPPPPPSENVVPREVLVNVMMAEALAFVLLGIFAYRSLLKRARERFSKGTPADSARLDQLQNAVDAIAVEVERISEGQRYVTKALGEGFQPVGSVGPREEAKVPRK